MTSHNRFTPLDCLQLGTPGGSFAELVTSLLAGANPPTPASTPALVASSSSRPGNFPDSKNIGASPGADSPLVGTKLKQVFPLKRNFDWGGTS